MIDFDTGTVGFDDGLVVSSSMTLAQARQVSPGREFQTTPGQYQVAVGAHRCHEREWGIGLVFAASRLHQVWIQCLNADGVDPQAWTLENEKVRKRFHDDFLKGLLKGITAQVSVASMTYGYQWGSIASTIDMRGVQSLIVIEYA